MTSLFDWLKNLFGGWLTALWVSGSLPGIPSLPGMEPGGRSSAEILLEIRQLLGQARMALITGDLAGAEAALKKADSLSIELSFTDKSQISNEKRSLWHELRAKQRNP